VSRTLYQKLPGGSRGALTYTRAYLGSDHILLVDVSDFRESYRRCFLRDIQAISFRPTLVGRAINAVLAVPVILSLLAVLLNPAENGWVWGGIGGVFLFFLGVNTVMGPTCVCSIRTPVQTLRLGSVGRVRALRRFLARVRPLIEGAQRGSSNDAGPAVAAEGAPPAADPAGAAVDAPPAEGGG
jgi:hypothetical protein